MPRIVLVGAGSAGLPYPHVYGPLRRDAVRGVRPVVRDAAGRFVGDGERRPA